MAEVKVEGVEVPLDATPQNRPDLFGTRGQLRPDGDGGIASYMAADKPEYATPDVSGVDSGFYVSNRGLPWHVSLARQLNVPELMAGQSELLRSEAAIAAMGANFEVTLEPVVVQGTDTVVPGKFATVRSDTRQPLGIVGSTWKAHQPLELAEFGDALAGTGQAKWETGGLMHNSSWMFISMELEGLDIVVPGDEGVIKQYLLLVTAFDGSKSTRVLGTDVRTVCNNTCNLAMKDAFATYTLRHCSTLAGRVQQAREVLGISFKKTESIRALTSTLALTKVVDSQVQAIIDAAWPVKGLDTDAEREANALQRQRAFANYENSDTLSTIRGTAWGAYNAITEFIDHETVYRGRLQEADEVRANSLLFGVGRVAKKRALDAALALAK